MLWTTAGSFASAWLLGVPERLHELTEQLIALLP
jgi:hypothetical protein